MKKPTRLYWATGLIMLTLFFTFCAKENNYTDPKKINTSVVQKANFTSLVAFQAMSQPPVQDFTVNASQAITVQCAQGSKVEIPAGSMMLNGVPVYAGNVKVHVKELLTRADMIKTGITTETESGMLESAGMMEMKAELNGQALSINPNNPPWVTFSAGNNRNYSGFGSFTLNTNNKWEYNDAKVEMFANNGQFYYRMPIKKMGWINCDRFWNYPNTIDIKIDIPEEFRLECKVYAVVHSLRSTMALYWDEAKTEFNVSCRGYRGIPDTFTVTAICESMKEGAFYACDTTFKMSPGIKLSLVPKHVDAEEYNESLNAKFE